MQLAGAVLQGRTRSSTTSTQGDRILWRALVAAAAPAVCNGGRFRHRIEGLRLLHFRRRPRSHLRACCLKGWASLQACFPSYSAHIGVVLNGVPLPLQVVVRSERPRDRSLVITRFFRSTLERRPWRSPSGVQPLLPLATRFSAWVIRSTSRSSLLRKARRASCTGRSPTNSLHTLDTVLTDALVQFGHSGGPMLDVASGTAVAINTRGHPNADPLLARLIQWQGEPATAAVPGLTDLMEYVCQQCENGTKPRRFDCPRAR